MFASECVFAQQVREHLRLGLVDGVGPAQPDAVAPDLREQVVQLGAGSRRARAARGAGSSIGRPWDGRSRSSGMTREERGRVERRPDRVGHPVLPLEVVDRVDATGRRDEVAAERAREAVDRREVRDRPARVPGRRLHDDARGHASGTSRGRRGGARPGRARRACPRRSRRRSRRTSSAAARGHRLGRSGRPPAPGPRSTAPCSIEPRVALALVAMVVGVEDPFDLLDADLGEMVEDRRGAGIDEQPGRPRPQQVDVAGIAEPEEVRRDLDERRSRARSRRRRGPGP